MTKINTNYYGHSIPCGACGHLFYCSEMVPRLQGKCPSCRDVRKLHEQQSGDGSWRDRQWTKPSSPPLEDCDQPTPEPEVGYMVNRAEEMKFWGIRPRKGWWRR